MIEVRRIWDDESMTYIVVPVESIGSGAVTEDDGWRYKGSSYLTEYAPGHGGWISPADPGLRNAPQGESYNNRPPGWPHPTTRTVGRPTSAAHHGRTCRCGRRKDHYSRMCSGCRRGTPQRDDSPRDPTVCQVPICGARLTIANQRQGVIRCNACRKAGRTVPVNRTTKVA